MSSSSGSAPSRHQPPDSSDLPEAGRLLAEVTALVDDLHVGTGPRVRMDSDLAADLGLDSLAVVELHDRLERAFAVRLSEDVLATAVTPADWLAAILHARGVSAGTGAAGAGGTWSPRPPGEPWSSTAATLTEALAWHVENHPDLVTIRLLANESGPSAAVTYGDLGAEAGTVARALMGGGLVPGERVAIMLPTQRAYFTVFLGILLAGGVPVPLYPPARMASIQEHLSRQALLLRNAGAAVLVTLPKAMAAGRLLRAQVPTLRSVHTPAALTQSGPFPDSLPSIDPDDLALIQYTSGSTGDPKGVMLTHAQLLANIRAMGEAAEVTTSDVFVSWLPLYHDMGLIGAWHAPLYFGLPLVAISPLSFLARPATWLQAISAYRGTLSAAPDFAYATCADRIADAELAGVDLSSWRLAFNGSEPVSPIAIERFVRRFAPLGFRLEAMCPAYGLAEVGVGAAFSPLGRGPRVDTVARAELAHSGTAVPLRTDEPGGRAVVGCGMPLPGYEIRVVDPLGRELPDRREGQVECRGPSATAGYFANEAASAALWRHGWLETGDLGYVADGELFLTGRSKDLVIRAGRNLHPEELEAAIGGLDGVRRGSVAVFSSPDPRRGTERLVVAVETDLATPEARSGLDAAIRRTALDVAGTPPDTVAMVPPGALLRTPNGKIRRGATREAFEDGTLGQHPAPVPLQLVRFALSGTGATGHRLVRSARTWIFAVYAWSLVALIGLPLVVALQLPLSLRARWRLARTAGDSLRALTGVTLRVEGALPAQRPPVVIVANHASFVDGLAVLLALPEPVVFVAGAGFERQPFSGSVLRRLGCAFVERDHAEQSESVIAQLSDLVRAGHSMVFFAEGSITRVPGLRPFRLGAFAVASATGCPVVPVGIQGTRDLVRPGTLLPHRADITVAIGSPISPTGTGIESQAELRDTTYRAVAELSGEPKLSHHGDGPRPTGRRGGT